MNTFFFQTVIILITTFCYLLICYVVGKSILSVYKTSNKIIESDALAIALANLIFVSSFAIITTSGKTYLIAFPLLSAALLIYTWSKKKLRLPNPPIKIKFKLVLLISFAIASFILCMRLFNLDGNILTIHHDYAFYGGIADYMNQYHVETTILDPLVIEQSYMPYHYFESWHAALLSKLTVTPGTLTLLAGVYLFNLTLLFLSFIEYIKPGHHKTLSVVFASVFLLVCHPLGEYISQFMHWVGLPSLGFVSHWGILTLIGMKLYVVYIWILLVQTYNPSGIIGNSILIIIMLWYPTALPIAIGYLLISWILRNPHYKSIYTNRIGLAFLFTFSIILVSLYPKELFWSVYSMGILFLCFPLSLAIFAYRKKQPEYLTSLTALVLIAFLTNLSIRILSRYISALDNPDMVQVSENVTVPFFIILSTFIVIEFSRTIILPSLITGVYAFAYFTSNTYTAAFKAPISEIGNQSSLMQLVKQHSDYKIGFISAQEKFNKSTFNWNVYFKIPHPDYRLISNNYFPIPMSVPDSASISSTKAKKTVFESVIKKTSYFKFISYNNAIDTLTQQAFVRTNSIDTVITY